MSPSCESQPGLRSNADPPELVARLLDRLRARRTAARAEWPAAWEELEKRARKARP